MTNLTSLLRKMPRGRWTTRVKNIDTQAAYEPPIAPSEDIYAPEAPKKPSPFRRKGTPASEEQLPTVSFEDDDTDMAQHHNRVKNKPVHYKSSSRALNNLSIPCPDPTREERIRDSHQNRALRLVRQEDWDKLITMITIADRDCTMTPGGMCVAELMAFGARADVVLAIEHALLDRTPEKDAPMMHGIEALEMCSPIIQTAMSSAVSWHRPISTSHGHGAASAGTWKLRRATARLSKPILPTPVTSSHPSTAYPQNPPFWPAPPAPFCVAKITQPNPSPTTPAPKLRLVPTGSCASI